jgi:nicotinate-nucleotide adenylyltransferase
VFDRASYSFSVLGGRAAHRFAAGRLTGPRAARRLAHCAPPAWVFLHIPRHPASATAWRRRHGGPPGHRPDAAADGDRSETRPAIGTAKR